MIIVDSLYFKPCLHAFKQQGIYIGRHFGLAVDKARSQPHCIWRPSLGHCTSFHLRTSADYRVNITQVVTGSGDEVMQSE